MFWYLGILYATAQESAEIEAERKQIRSEMERFQRQQLWKGLNKKYELLLETVDEPTDLLYEDHLMGAIAAQEIGRLHLAIQRYEWLVAVNPTASEGPWLEYLKTQTVYVGLRCPPKNDGIEAPYLPEEISFSMVNPPFEPELILAVNTAEQSLKNNCIYKGNLPLGEYQFMGKTLPITEWDKLDDSIVEEKNPRVSFETQKKILDTISKKTVVARDDVFHIHMRAGLLGTYVGDSTEIGPEPFWSYGPVFGVGSRREFAETAFVLGTDLAFHGTYQMEGNLLGGGLSFWAGTPLILGESKIMPYLGGLFDISRIFRIGVTGLECETDPEYCAAQKITAFPTSSGIELGLEFGTLENRFYNLRTSTRSDSERWYSTVELSLIQLF